MTAEKDAPPNIPLDGPGQRAGLDAPVRRHRVLRRCLVLMRAARMRSGRPVLADLGADPALAAAAIA
ncbi:hypothetical protein ACWCSH_13460, partial [Streptosporangium sp. NPDC001682]